YDTQWILLVQILLPRDETAARLSEPIRIDLAGQVLAGLWSRAEVRAELKDFVRRWFGYIKSTPPEAIGGTESPTGVSELERLFTDAAAVAGRVALNLTQVPPVEEAAGNTDLPLRYSPGYLLQSMVELQKVPDRRRMERLTRQRITGAIAIIAGFTITAAALVPRTEIIRYLAAIVPVAAEELWIAAIPLIGMFTGVFAALKWRQLIFRGIRRKAVLNGFRFLRRTALVTSEELRGFLRRTYGDEAADRIVRKVEGRQQL
ncbi:MAG: hypothetical protein EA404_00880, partial [Spirochaetaceae bacterium]